MQYYYLHFSGVEIEVETAEGHTVSKWQSWDSTQVFAVAPWVTEKQ